MMFTNVLWEFKDFVYIYVSKKKIMKTNETVLFDYVELIFNDYEIKQIINK